MNQVVRCRFDSTGPGTPAASQLSGPVGQAEAWELSEVAAVLAEAEAAARRGRHVAGFVAYEAAPAFDRALAVVPRAAAEPGRHTRLPLAWFGYFTDEVLVAPLPRPVAAGPLVPGRGGQRGAGDEHVGDGWECEMGEAEHSRGVGAVRSSIEAGDVYLANFTARFRSAWDTTKSPAALYRRLVAGHSGGYHALIETEEWAVACGSPELLFSVSAGGGLVARPMKGTAPRGRWSGEDVSLGEALQSSPKERAENVMVVDLLRNDLGRVAVPGSVRVPELWALERHPTVWQLTSTVTADPRPGTCLGDIFAAVFPGGSVTGAPKAAAMALIASLERSPRGVYCGAVGRLWPVPALAGSRPPLAEACFAVGIRTAVVDKLMGVVEYGSGGGITWDSSASAEWDELHVKTRALGRSWLGRSAGGPPGGAATASGSRPGRRSPAGRTAPPYLVCDGLIETMAYIPHGPHGPLREPEAPEAADGLHLRNLEAHLDRLRASAEYFGFRWPEDLRQRLAEAVAVLAQPARARVVLRRDGALEVSTSDLERGPSGPPGRLLELCVDPGPVMSDDVALFHKTTDRRPYEERSRRHPGADDVVLVNELGQATETTRANLGVLLDGQWVTPPLGCGLLPGVERARLVANGALVERVVTVPELLGAQAAATFSSLRGWQAARVLPCRCSAMPGT